MRLPFLLLFLIFGGFTFAQDIISQDLILSDYVEGTLLIPKEKTKTVAIIIPGSGPTDRDGNINFGKNNSLKFLAEDLSKNGIATFRYDKRALTLLKKRMLDERSIRFEHFVDDVKQIIRYFKMRRRYDKIFIIGHSQGSLVGMLAANENVDGFVSLAGPGKSIDQTLLDQIAIMNSPELLESGKKTLALMRDGKIDKNYHKGLASVFNVNLQPFMMSWMKYKPTDEIKKLDIPVLIINGTKDLQISVEEAELLKAAKPTANYVLIENMNHVLKEIKSDDDQENSKAYNLPRLKNAKELAPTILTFIKK